MRLPERFQRRRRQSASPTQRRRSVVVPIWDLSALAGRQILGRIVLASILACVILISAIAVVKAVTWVDRPFAGFLVNERLVLGNIGQYYWSGSTAGLQWPDKIVAANGESIRSMRELLAVVQGVLLRTPIVYTVERDGERRDVTVPTMRFSWNDLVMTFGVTFVAGWIYILIGLTVFLLKPDTKVSWAFFVACVSLSLFAITSFDIQSTHAGFIRVYLLVNTLWPAAFVHLALVFPARREFIERRPYLQVAPYVVAAALTIPLEIFYPQPAFLQVYKIVRLFGILSAVAVLISTLEAYVRGASVLARQRAKVVLFGAALAFPLPAVAYYLSLFGADWVWFTIQNNFLAIPITVFPACVAYAIARHNLFDVDVYIKRAVGYAAMTAVVAVGYLSTNTFISTFLLRPLLGERGDTIAPLVFAVLIVFLFHPLSRRVQQAVDTLFFRKGYDYKGTIQAVSNALTSMLNLDQIMTQVVETIRREMFVETVGIVVVGNPAQPCEAVLLEEADAPDQATRPSQATRRQAAIGYDDPLLAWMRPNPTLLTRYDLDEDPRFAGVRAEISTTLRELSASLVIPLTYRGQLSGVLTLGNKKSGHFYSREDIDLLTTMSDQAAVAISNAMKHEEVVRYADELAASLRRVQILENIKTNLSKFVPTTVKTLIEQSPEAPLLEKRETDVSVLFADITGYTKLSAELPLDQVNNLVERYFGAFLDEIVECGGEVNETAGDGLMVIFQAPEPRQHAESAIRAANGIQRRARAMNEELKGVFEPIIMHVGVNSGIASVGATKIEGAAGSRWTYTASGSTTNIAARLAALSEGGDVVLSEETRRRVGEALDVEDLGFRTLKNVPQPMRVYRIDTTARALDPAVPRG